MAHQVESSLQFQMEEAGVSAEVQKKIYAHGFTTLRTFAGLEESRAEVREVLKTDFGLDPAGNASLRKEVALLLSVWEAARSHLSFQEKNKQESKNGCQNRLVQASDYAAMRAAVEVLHGRLRDKEAPSKSLVASKLEHVEDGAPVVEDLRDVTSLEDAEVEAYNAVIDPSSATLKIRPGKTMTTPPASPEDLRLRHRRIGLAWDFIKSRHTTRAWLPSSAVDIFRRLSDHVLGSTIAGLRSADGRSPSWALVLGYELEVRKAAYRYVRDGEAKCLQSGLSKAMENPQIMTVHFSIPFSLGKSDLGLDGSGAAANPALANAPVDVTRKRLPTWDRQWGKASKTPEGRMICFRFQKGACKEKQCRFAHVCQRCFGRHGFAQCRFKKPAQQAQHAGKEAVE